MSILNESLFPLRFFSFCTGCGKNSVGNIFAVATNKQRTDLVKIWHKLFVDIETKTAKRQFLEPRLSEIIAECFGSDGAEIGTITAIYQNLLFNQESSVRIDKRSITVRLTQPYLSLIQNNPETQIHSLHHPAPWSSYAVRVDSRSSCENLVTQPKAYLYVYIPA